MTSQHRIHIYTCMYRYMHMDCHDRAGYQILDFTPGFGVYDQVNTPECGHIASNQVLSLTSHIVCDVHQTYSSELAKLGWLYYP